MTSVKPYERLTPDEIRRNMDHRATCYCNSVVALYMNGKADSDEWERLLIETADNLRSLVAAIREVRRDRETGCKFQRHTPHEYENGRCKHCDKVQPNRPITPPNGRDKAA